MRPTYALINLKNLKKNFLSIREKVGNSKIMAVVKADAYGHGAEEVVKALNSLADKRPEYYAVAIPEESDPIRKTGIEQPLLVLEPFNAVQVGKLIENDLTATVFTKLHLEILLEGRKKLRPANPDFKIKVHVKVDTGMNRLGIRYDEAPAFIRDLSMDKNFVIDGIYTHFATSDDKDKSFTMLQLGRFKSILSGLKEQGFPSGLIHAANSAAIMDIPDSYFDMVRPGISLYGCYPSSSTSESVKLEPVMSLISEVSSVKSIEAGETVSYGRTFKAECRTKIISVPIGYADGYSRRLSNKTKAIINGKYYPQIGTVTMDRTMFNVFDDDINVGDKVILLGKEAELEISAYEWSDLLSTIPYEIMCGISKRVPRVYVN